MTMRRLQQIMTGESIMAELLNRRQHEHALEARVRRALPPSLAACVVVADGRSPELSLAAVSGAAAALLRQRTPDLLRALAAEGCEFTGIRVRVQAHPKSQTRANPSKKQIDALAALHLTATAKALGDSPLADALARLVRRAAVPESEQQERPTDREKHEDDEQ
jgi:Dna[CI] antecedent DciA-like protein